MACLFSKQADQLFALEQEEEEEAARTRFVETTFSTVIQERAC